MKSIRHGQQLGALKLTSIITLCAAAAAPGLALAGKPGGGGTTWTVRLQGAGDSIMQGYNASCTGNTTFADLLCYSGAEQPENSFFDGTSAAVVSLADRFIAAGASTTYSKAASQSGSEMVGGSNNFKTQATKIVNSARKPVQVKVELGGNDICNRTSTATMYTEAQWRTAVKNGLDVLTQKLPDGSTVVLVGVPRVQDLHDRAMELDASSSRVSCPSFWDTYNVCEIATLEGTMGGQDLATRLLEIGERQAAYNVILVEEAAAYNLNARQTGVEVVAETDNAGTDVGTYTFLATDINGGDCFHPSIAGQNKLSVIIWGNDPYKTRP
jgi:hypothetical protein